MENGKRPPVDWDAFKKTATVVEVPALTLGRARDRADVKPPGRVGTRSKQGAAKTVGAGRPQGGSSNGKR